MKRFSTAFALALLMLGSLAFERRASAQMPAPISIGVGGAVEPSQTAESAPPTATDITGLTGAASPSEANVEWFARFHGELELRGNALSSIPLRAMPFEPSTGSLGQNLYVESWMRLRFDAGIRNAVRLVFQADVLDGALFGDRAIGVSPARSHRDATIGFGADSGCGLEATCSRQDIGVDPRYLYLEWQSEQSVVRIGQQAFTWGLGLLANDGDTAPLFGDYRYGDIVERVLFAIHPLGPAHPWVVSVAGDLVFDDGLANIVRGDRAYQGVLATMWKEERFELGAMGVYRHQDNKRAEEDVLEVGVFDLYARGDFDDPAGGKIHLAFEGALVAGRSSLARTASRPYERVLQGFFAVDASRRARRFDVGFEFGWSSGDSSTEDGAQTRGVMDADHRIGLILFPEVLAWQTARASAYGSSSTLLGTAPRGLEYLPSDGGVAGAFYMFPRVVWRPLDWLEAKAAAVLARTTTDVVDPVEQGLSSRRVNYRGGDASARDLGLELDASLIAQHWLSRSLGVAGGIEGGVLFAGEALADATGRSMKPIGLVRLRAGFRW